ncbi:MAG TPA: hypothetical protein VK982_03920 [Bacteroidales bacterium]|nr:hypothetical protein [Bacteroidales bacterium]
MDRYQKRVLRLREHVLKNEKVETYVNVNTEHENMYRVEENDLAEQPINGDSEDINTIGIDDITKADIIEILTQKGIQHNARDKKEFLYNLMVKGD